MGLQYETSVQLPIKEGQAQTAEVTLSGLQTTFITDSNLSAKYIVPTDSDKAATIDGVSPQIEKKSFTLDLLTPRLLSTSFTIDTRELAYEGYDYKAWNVNDSNGTPVTWDGGAIYADLGQASVQHPAFTHWFPTATPNASAAVISSSSNQYTLPTVDGGEYDFTVEWGDGSSNTINSWNQSEITHTYASDGVYEIQITGLFKGVNFHRSEATGKMDCRKLIETKSWGSGFFIDVASYVDVYNANNISSVAGVKGGVWDGCVNWYDTAEKAPLFAKCGTAKTEAPSGDGREFAYYPLPFRGTNKLDSDLSYWTSATDRFTGSLRALGSTRAPLDDINFRYNWHIDLLGLESARDAITNPRRAPADPAVFQNLGSSFSKMQGTGTNFDITNWNFDPQRYSLQGLTTASNKWDGDTSGAVNSSCTNLTSSFSKNPSFTGKGVNTWDTSNVTLFVGTFTESTAFNAVVSHFKISDEGVSFSSCFKGCSSFNKPISPWGDGFKNITTCSRMFDLCTSFNNGDVTENSLIPWTDANWEKCVGFYEMFDNCHVFNQDISRWIMPSAQNFTSQHMFLVAKKFNSPVNTHTVGDVKYWDMSQCTNMYGMFQSAASFDQPLGAWDTSSVTRMDNMFNAAKVFNQDISDWDTSSVTGMNAMFRSAELFNQPLTTSGNKWNLSSVTDISSMFLLAKSFNQPLNSWDTSSVEFMSSTFSKAFAFNQSLSSWDTSSVTNMKFMFQQASVFNQDLSSWDVSKVINMEHMFINAVAFTGQGLSGWNVGSCTNMSHMFYSTAFSADLSSWDVSKVTKMDHMFYNVDNFNHNVAGWTTSANTTTRQMFFSNNSFNRDLSNWDMSNVTDARTMFRIASAFDQDLSGWDLSGIVQITDGDGTTGTVSVGNDTNDNGDFSSGIINIFDQSGMSKANLDATISDWCDNSGIVSGAQLGTIPLNNSDASQQLSTATINKMTSKGMTAFYSDGTQVPT